jgi:VanZ family protein
MLHKVYRRLFVLSTTEAVGADSSGPACYLLYLSGASAGKAGRGRFRSVVPNVSFPENWQILRRPLAWLTAAYTAVLVFATHYPKPEVFLGPEPPPDKALHFIAYGILGMLVAATLATARHWSRPVILATIPLLAVFAAIDEATQPMFGRHADVADWCYDMVGLTVGFGLVVAVRRWLMRRT